MPFFTMCLFLNRNIIIHFKRNSNFCFGSQNIIDLKIFEYLFEVTIMGVRLFDCSLAEYLILSMNAKNFAFPWPKKNYFGEKHGVFN